MALSDILTGSPLVRGGGLAGAMAQGLQGYERGVDKRRSLDALAREQAWQDKQRSRTEQDWTRTDQEREMVSAPALEGETDADRLERIAGMAGKLGRGDLESNYKAKAQQIRSSQRTSALSTAAEALQAGNYGGAIPLLNSAWAPMGTTFLTWRTPPLGRLFPRKSRPT
jgi:hypothetical protein